MKEIFITDMPDVGIIYISLNDSLSQLIRYKFNLKYNKIGFFIKNVDTFTVYTMNVVNENNNLVETNDLNYWMQNSSVMNLWIKKLNPILINQLFNSELTSYIQSFFRELIWMIVKLSKNRDINIVLDNWLHILCTGKVIDYSTYYEKQDIEMDNSIQDKEDEMKKDISISEKNISDSDKTTSESTPISDSEKTSSSVNKTLSIVDKTTTITKSKIISIIKKKALTSFQIVNLVIWNLQLEIKNIRKAKIEHMKVKIHFPKKYYTYEFADKLSTEKIFGKLKQLQCHTEKIDNYHFLDQSVNMGILIKFLELYNDVDFKTNFEEYHNKKINYTEVITYITQIYKITNDNFTNLFTELNSGKISTSEIIENKNKLDKQFSKLSSILGKDTFFNNFQNTPETKEYLIIPDYQKVNKNLIMCYNHILECVMNIKNGEEPHLNVNLVSNMLNLLTKKMNMRRVPFLEGEYSYKGAFVVKSIYDKPLKVQLKSKKKILLTTAGKNDFSQFNKLELEEILLHLDNIADGSIKIDNLRSQLLIALSERHRS